MPRIGGDVSGFFKAQEMVGERGIVAVHLGNNPGGQIAELFGSENFALMSALERDLMHRLVHREQASSLPCWSSSSLREWGRSSISSGRR
jgi:hypothetical protein